MSGRRAAGAYPPNGVPLPLADYPPGNGYEHAPGHPSAAGSGPDGYPDYPAAPGHQDLPDYPQDAYAPAGHPPMLDYPPMPDYPSTPGYPSTPDYPHGYRTADGHQPGYPATEYVPNGYPAPGPPPASYPRGGYAPGGYPRGGYPHEAYPAAGQPQGGYPAGGSQVVDPPATGSRWVVEGAPVTHEEYIHPGGLPAGGADVFLARPATARQATAGAAPVDEAPAVDAPVDDAPAYPVPATGPEGAQWAMLAYLTVPFFGFLMPLAIYLRSLHGSGWVRAHAAQAINVWLTGIMYDLSLAIIGAMLVLDSPHVALTVVVPLITVLWLTTLAFLVRAAAVASRGEAYTFPRWLCTPIFR